MYSEQLDIELDLESPFAIGELQDLANWLSHNPCDHTTFRMTKRFLLDFGIDQEEAIAWLEERGAACDCEALSAVCLPRLKTWDRKQQRASR